MIKLFRLRAAGKPANLSLNPLTVAKEFVAKNGVGALYNGYEFQI